LDEPPSYTLLAVYSDSGLIYILLACLAILLGGSSFLSAAEGAFFSLSPSDLKKFSQSKNRGRNVVATLMLESATLSNTISGLRLFIRILLLGIVAVAILFLESSEATALQALTTVLFFLLIVASETLPKVYGRKNRLRWASAMAVPWSYMLQIGKPMASLITTLNRYFERKSESVTEEELDKVLELTTESEPGEEEKEILRSVVNFGTLTVRQVMRSRREISTVQRDLKFSELIRTVVDFGYSRVPVYNKTQDKVEGILYIKDLLPFIDHDDSFAWQNLIRSSFEVAEHKKIDALLKDFQERRVLLAIVKDAHGKTAGLITLADIIEIIIRDITDESAGKKLKEI